MEHKTQRTMAKKVFRILFMLLIAVFGIYLAIQFIIIFHRGYKTETAIAYTMADSISLQGVVSFDTVRVDGSGDLGYLVSDGERVTNGTVLAECYTDDSQGLLRERLDRLGRTIDLLSKSQNSSGSDLSLLTSQTRQALYNLLDKLDTAQYSGITDAEDAFLLAQNRMQVNTGQTEGFTQTIQVLQTEYDGIKAQLGDFADHHRRHQRLFQQCISIAHHRDRCCSAGCRHPGGAERTVAKRLSGGRRHQLPPGRSPQASAGSSTLSATWPRRIGWTAFPV